MGPFVRHARPLDGYRLELDFDNGERRVFDVAPYLDRGAFGLLRDGRFSAVRVVAGSVEWPGGLDLSYDTLYLRGTPILAADVAEVQR